MEGWKDSQESVQAPSAGKGHCPTPWHPISAQSFPNQLRSGNPLQHLAHLTGAVPHVLMVPFHNPRPDSSSTLSCLETTAPPNCCPLHWAATIDTWVEGAVNSTAGVPVPRCSPGPTSNLLSTMEGDGGQATEVRLCQQNNDHSEICLSALLGAVGIPAPVKGVKSGFR